MPMYFVGIDISKYKHDCCIISAADQQIISKFTITNDKVAIFSNLNTSYSVGNAKVLCRYFDYDLEKMQSADTETLSAIPGVGEVLAGAFTEYMSDAENLEQIEHLKQFLTIEVPQVDENAQTLSGMSFVVTGSLNHYASRNDLKEVIEERGGKVTGSVTGKTTCLINNDITSTSSKNKKAKELQVPILTEEDFLKTYNIPYEE